MKYNVARGYLWWVHAKVCLEEIMPGNRSGIKRLFIGGRERSEDLGKD